MPQRLPHGISRMEIRQAKDTLRAHPHLLFVGRIFQPGVLCVEPAWEVKIVGVQDDELHSLT